MSAGDEARFGDRLRAAREAAGLGIREAARHAGLDPRTYDRLERGERQPAWPTLLRLLGRDGFGLETFFPAAWILDSAARIRRQKNNPKRH